MIFLQQPNFKIISSISYKNNSYAYAITGHKDYLKGNDFGKQK